MASPRRTRPSSATYPPTSKVSGAPLWSANPRAASSAFIYKKPVSIIEPDYVWAYTDKWINFPWSTLPVIKP